MRGALLDKKIVHRHFYRNQQNVKKLINFSEPSQIARRNAFCCLSNLNASLNVSTDFLIINELSMLPVMLKLSNLP